MKDSVLTQLTVLKTAPADTLKARWRELFAKQYPTSSIRIINSGAIEGRPIEL